MRTEVLSIGDFSRMTQLSVKTLRHYHDVGLVEPHHVDPATGYRYYSRDQVPIAQVVRRLRGLDMPIPEVRSVLAADPDHRNAVISAHLGRLEDQLAATRDAVKALRDILDRPGGGPVLEHRSVPAVSSIAVHADVDRDDLPTWWQGAIAELQDTVRQQRLEVAGPPGGLYGFDVFATDRGPATVFIPIASEVLPRGRVSEFTVPAAELVVTRDHDHVGLGRPRGAVEDSVAGLGDVPEHRRRADHVGAVAGAALGEHVLDRAAGVHDLFQGGLHA